MIRTRVSFKGRGRTLAKAFRNAVDNNVKRRLRSAMVEAVKEFNQTYVLPVTPMDKGDLRESNYVSLDAFSLNEMRVSTGFDAPYAAIVHEMPNDTNWTTAGTGNKYLQRPYFSYGYLIPGMIAKKVRL